VPSAIDADIDNEGIKLKKIALLLCLCLLAASCEQGEPKVAGKWYTQSQLDLGKKIYSENCIGCHNKDAQGTFDWKQTGPDGSYPPPPLNGTAHAWHHSISVLKRTIAQGGIPLGGKMPGFGAKLNDDEQLAVISYFQSFWSNEIYQGWLQRGGTN
jgi:mono/diheme cytochrome c family protein